MNLYTLLLISLLIQTTSCSQNPPAVNRAATLVGGPCEGCEALLEYGQQRLQAIDTLPDFEQSEPKMVIGGRVFQANGKTPAEGVIIYIYHTNRQGVYPTTGRETGWGRRHGYLRGWVKTDANGRYTFFTHRPASYPNRPAPEHIHITIKEPGKNPYFMDEFIFADDPLLTADYLASLPNRGGSGLLNLEEKEGMLVGKRDLILGLNIPNY